MQRIPPSLLLLSILLGIVWLPVSRTLQAQTVFERPFLLTEDEAVKLRLPRGHDRFKSAPSQETAQLPSSGPTIIFRRPPLMEQTATPPTLTVTTPLDLSIAFQSNRATVNMDSLEVRARKGFLSQSLTDRLRPYIEGTTLTVQNLCIPVGTFRIEISIADHAGTRTIQTYYLEVRENPRQKSETLRPSSPKSRISGLA